MSEMSDLEDYFKWQFEQLNVICSNSISPWIFLCLSAFMDYLSCLFDSRPSDTKKFRNLIIDRYPNAYKDFTYTTGTQDLPDQMYYTLRNGLVHKFSLMPNDEGKAHGARFRSLNLAHRSSGLKHLAQHVDPKNGIDAAILIAEDLLKDTKDVVDGMLVRAKSDLVLQQKIIDFIKKTPPVAGTELPLFWMPK